MRPALLLGFLPASIAWSGAGGAVFFLLALLGLAVAVPDLRAAARELRRMPLLLAVVGLAVGTNLASLLLLDLHAREFSLVPLLLVPALVLAASRDRVPLGRVSAGGAAGGALAFAVTLAEWSRVETDPIIGSLNAIVFAQLAWVCAAFALAGAAAARDGRQRVVLAAGAALGIAAVLASGTRGAIVALPLLAGVLWPHRGRWRALAPPTRRGVAVAALAAVLAGAALATQSGLSHRFARIGEEVEAYRAGDVGQRSVSTRLALWQASLQIAREHPWFGVGANRFKPELERLQARGGYPEGTALYSHPHNTLLSVLVQYGVVGLAVLVGGLVAGWRALGGSAPELRALGRTLICAWFLLGLTNDVLAHQNTLRCIAFCWAILAAAHILKPGAATARR